MKKLKNANGSGSISKMSGRRRKPWRVRVTDGYEITYDENGKPHKKTISKLLGCYETYDEAFEALKAYRQSPYDVDAHKLTFSEVYEMWSKEYFENISPSAAKTVRCASRYCTPIYDMRMIDLRVKHLEDVIRSADTGDATKSRIKSIFNMMYRYAIAHEIVSVNYAQSMFVATGTPYSNKTEKVKKAFSEDEIRLLWDYLDEIPFVDMVLIGIYSGWRPQELCMLKLEDIDLNVGIMRGGQKTESGKNRIVPIHPDIIPLIESRVASAKRLNSEYLFNDPLSQTGIQLTYDKYRRKFERAMLATHLEGFSAHCTRVTFVTLGKEYDMNEYALKLIVGHYIDDVSERIYTRRTIDDLRREINKIKIERKSADEKEN